MDPAAVAKMYPPAYLAEDNSQVLMNVAVAWAVMETIFVILYYVSRVVHRSAFGWEMAFMPLAYLFNISMLPTVIVLIKHGGSGRHTVAVPPDELLVWLKMQFVVFITYPLAATLPKLCILAMYLKIFTTRTYRHITYAIGAVVILTWVANFITAFSICRPLAYTWDKTIPGGACGNTTAFVQFSSLPNIITDVAMLILPLPVVWRLHTGFRQKIGLTVVFLTGSLGIITSIARFVIFSVIDVYSDPTWLSVAAMAVTVVEPGMYLIAACLPSLRPLFKHFFDHPKVKSMFSSVRGYGGSKHGYARDASRDLPLVEVNAAKGQSRDRFVRIEEQKDSMSHASDQSVEHKGQPGAKRWGWE